MLRPFLLALAFATPLSAQEVPLFADETASSGLSVTFAGEWEYMVGGGVATFDCTGDSLPEMVIAGGTNPTSLWRNDSAVAGALAFSPIPDTGVELTAVAGAYALDIDSDAMTDLVLLRVGENVVLRGLGDCRFERANEAWGFDGGDAWSAAFAATWEKGQTWPTLAIGNYIDRMEEAFPWGSCTDNWLHRPDGAGFAPPLALKPSFCALSMLFTDWNRSGQPALRIANDREYYKGGQEQLWHLDPGAEPRLYTEAEGWSRLRLWGMGIAGHDLNFDGYPEYFVTSMADNKLQTLAEVPADGKPVRPKYADIGFKRGVTAHRPYTGGETKPSTAWHTQFEDVNNDGLADLFIAKGNVWAMPDFAMKDPNNLLLQKPDGTFTEAGDRAGVASMQSARGGAVVDFNADGWLDLVVINRNSPVEIWRNTGTGSAANWVAVTPRQAAPNIDAIGAWVEVKTGETTQRREVTVGGGHAGGVFGPQHFGLGTATAAEVRVIWPDGVSSDWQAVQPGTVMTITR